MLRKSDEGSAEIPAEPVKRETRTFAVITGGSSSSSCTLFRDGTSVSSSKGNVTVVARDGTKTVQAGGSYTVTKEWNADDTLKVTVKVHP